MDCQVSHQNEKPKTCRANIGRLWVDWASYGPDPPSLPPLLVLWAHFSRKSKGLQSKVGGEGSAGNGQ